MKVKPTGISLLIFPLFARINNQTEAKDILVTSTNQYESSILSLRHCEINVMAFLAL